MINAVYNVYRSFLSMYTLLVLQYTTRHYLVLIGIAKTAEKWGLIAKAIGFPQSSSV